MGRVSRARRVATAAMYGGGGIGVLGALATGLIVSQIRHAERTIPITETAPPCGDGVYGGHLPGEPLRLVVLGDSSAAGLGVDSPEQTTGAVLAGHLARIAGRPVRMECLAVVGALSQDLTTQVEQARPLRPELALIMIGGNDVTHRVWPSVAVSHLAAAVRALRALGAEVVVGTCPDLGTIQPIQYPLRWVARRWSRELAAAQTIAVVEAGGRTVSLGDLLGPEFARSPERFFGADQFHPSADGYAAAAAAILPAFVVSLALTDQRLLRPASSSGVSSLPRAAVTAAYHAGTEVSGTEVAGSERGPAGRWAELRQWVLGWTRTGEPEPRDEIPRADGPPVPGSAAEARPRGDSDPPEDGRGSAGADDAVGGDAGARPGDPDELEPAEGAQARQRAPVGSGSVSGWFAMPAWPSVSRWNLLPGRRKP